MTATTRVVVPRQRLVPWASGVLNLPADATDAQRRARLFAAVREANYIPSPELEQAITVLGQSGDELTLYDCGWQALADAEHDEAQREIEAFAARFFKLAPEPRREKWSALRNRYGHFVAWRRRLASLEPGLKATPRSSSDARAQKLIDHIYVTFVLPPAERVSRDATLLRETQQRPARWRSAAVRVLNRHRQAAELAPHLICELIDRSPHERWSVPIRRFAGAVASPIVGVLGLFRSGYWWIALIVLINSLRACSYSDSPSRVPDSVMKRMEREAGNLKFYPTVPSGAKKIEKPEQSANRALNDHFDVYSYDGKKIFVPKSKTPTNATPSNAPRPGS